MLKSKRTTWGIFKKAVAGIIALCLLLSGCSMQARKSSSSTKGSKQEIHTDPTLNSTGLATVPGTTSTTAPATEPSTAPATIPATVPATSPATIPATIPATPPATTPTTPPTPTPPTQPTTPPTTTPSTTPTTPATPSRPTSSATSKDTGSSQVWQNPNPNALDAYEEKDPTRASYLQYLQSLGKIYYFVLQEPEMRMYLGRTYGIPLYTNYELMMATTWSSSDPSVATVNEYGFVTPLKKGQTVVTISCFEPESQETFVHECTITVKDQPTTYAELEQLAHEEAKKIADFAMNYPTAKTDLDRIAIAAAIVNQYVAAGTYASYVGGYNQPFGTLVTYYSTCAGSTRATGLVLEYMGFQWYHVGSGQYTHQWCVVYDVDGQTAFADGSVLGMAGYGTWQGDGSNWRQFKDDQLVAVDAYTIYYIQMQTILPEM